MIKEVEVTEKVIKKHRYCDVCGTEIKKSLACSNATCNYCKKDLCNDCVAEEEDTYGDYRTVYCKRCSDIKKEYEELMEPYRNEIEKLTIEMRKKCQNE